MALEKQDLKQIEVIVENSEQRLALVMKNSFEDVYKRFDGVDKRFEYVDKRFDGVDKRFDKIDAEHRHFRARLDVIETDLSNLRELHKEVKEIRLLLDEVVTRKEFEKLEHRITRVERHLGLIK